MSFSVAQLNRNQLDAAGVMVEQIYIKIDALYAVYRTEERVVIQYADDPQKGADQRKSLSELYVTRGAIDILIDEMRDSGDRALVARAQRYERRLADALTLGLQGQTNQARSELDKLNQDLIEERRSRARQAYLISSLGVGAALILLIAILSSPLVNFGLAPAQLSIASNMWFAAAVGTVGAFFSSALAIRDRGIEPSISTRDTMVDAGLRMFVGALSGALLYTLVRVGAFGLILGGAKIYGNDPDFTSGKTGWLLVLLVAFVAGFTERLLPNLLAGASMDGKDAKPGMSSRSAAEDAASSELNPLGKGGAAAVAAAGEASPAPAVPDDPEKDVDDCCDRPATPDLVTQDVELPEALGGVEPAPEPAPQPVQA